MTHGLSLQVLLAVMNVHTVIKRKIVGNREHRGLDCPAFELVRWHHRVIFQLAPRSALLYGLWPFPDGLAEWQASLELWAFPVISRSTVPHKCCFFTDGSCLFPAMADIIQRAEILAGAIATAFALHPVVISDSLYFVRLARRLLDCWVEGRCPVWPAENLDLWEYFWSALSGCEPAEFVWTKAHRSFVGLEGLDLLIAQGNDAAESHAKDCVKQCQSTSSLYRKVVQGKLKFLRGRSLLDAFHIHLALAAVGQENGEYKPPCVPEELVLSGACWKASEIRSPLAGFHEQFVSQIFNWFLALQ